jgi:hypothetical protein
VSSVRPDFCCETIPWLRLSAGSDKHIAFRSELKSRYAGRPTGRKRDRHRPDQALQWERSNRDLAVHCAAADFEIHSGVLHGEPKGVRVLRLNAPILVKATLLQLVDRGTPHDADCAAPGGADPRDACTRRDTPDPRRSPAAASAAHIAPRSEWSRALAPSDNSPRSSQWTLRATSSGAIPYRSAVCRFVFST